MAADGVLANLLAEVRGFVDRGQVPGLIVGVLADGDVSLAAAGTTEFGGDVPLTPAAQMRISSNTKPLVAALTLALAEDGVLALDDPIERFVPELANRPVLRRLDGQLSDTVPAARPVTIEDLLTMRLGFGFVFESACPAVDAATGAGLGIGPPDPSLSLTPDEWLARFAELPLLEQPGTVWRYDLAFGVLGVLLARAAGRPLGDVLGHRLLAPLGMADTGFVARPGRLPTCYTIDESGPVVFDGAGDSRWLRPPSFPDARGGLVSTASDLLQFAGMLLDGGGGVLSRESVTAMTTDQLTDDQRGGPLASLFLEGSGWGYGVEVATPAQRADVPARRYGWGGGLGTLWYSWPEQRAAAVLLTQLAPPPHELIVAFCEAVEGPLLSPR